MRPQGRGPRPRCPGRRSAPAGCGPRRPSHTWPGPAHGGDGVILDGEALCRNAVADPLVLAGELGE
eukprot:9316927-Lingulodinium_polyedra.AAC.1